MTIKPAIEQHTDRIIVLKKFWGIENVDKLVTIKIKGVTKVIQRIKDSSFFPFWKLTIIYMYK